ncbi:NAD-dependent 4,6-dehydratase LegB [Bradyrhizobium diazoefficiens]|uniref:Blr5989 protein n=2 Tax=Bradyrhizobium diazoefficiens TaxID=1355477 RepID=Q89HK1_BRADU|nr:NAD-dependent 4,6-dehydratase LegB [Bradyrhizobium diazoefficiens]AND91127.1 NAD-dependent dehydratase [Bradyrhizobium diazoefficiens USDA 110]QBP24752.1 SDR family NAD(P)-dependent oxidoreductase [Bradyrhizobium diazoefficiens]QLD42276.1 SDR family NAD(P)-dependent oxidoreductase [Bradyrhizobium diazoefficiens]WLB36159.1 NAD-dependent 4,6-dehydratase LegB [Bradyrhizobium diazoefficiens]WLC18839.1 NAD-dependent 4,6-dehydratase LegB [Bradyrhizobium diazoefficiens]
MADLRDARVLVTGSDGFIGSHVVEELVKAGARVKAIVYYNSFNSWGWLDTVPADVMKSVEVVAGDIRDPHFMIAAASGCTDVLHLAALIAIPFSYVAPDSYVETNVRGTVNVLQAARLAGVRRFVQTSTSEVYGTAQTVPIKENHPLVGQSPYSASKIASDQMALSFQASFDMPVVVIRPFNTYGPRQSARAVIPTIISQIATGKRKIRLGAVSPTRDFSFVTDTARGLIAGLTAPAEQSVGQTINLGSGFEISVGATVEMIADVMGVDIEIETDEARLRPANSEVERLWADNSKARQQLGWAPEFGGLEGMRRGIENTVSWFTNPANLSRYKADVYNV